MNSRITLALVGIAVLSTALLSAVLLPAADTAGNWMDVPYVAQPKDGCGAAAISMVMQYWAKQPGNAVRPEASAAADPQTIQRLLFVPAEKGIPATAMRDYFQHSGFSAYAFRGQWDDLHHHVSLGRPLVVSLRASGPHGPLHYAVIVGLDWQRNFVFLNDPARGKMLRFSRERFLAEWNPADNWALLAIPAAAAPAGAQ